jgi:transmembrane sensor
MASERPPPADPLVAAAETWVRRHRAGLDAEGRRELLAWLAADPRHAAAYTRADPAGTELDWPLHSGLTEQVLERLDLLAQKRRKRRRRSALTVSALAAVAVALATGLLWPRRAPPAAASAPSSLVVLRPRTERLADGTVVELKDGARIAADFRGTERLVVLSHGTAHFQVTKNPRRPFIVTAGGVKARAVGTAFSVELNAKDVTVVVTAGRVAVNSGRDEPDRAPAEPAAILEAGRAIVVSLAPEAAPGAVELRTLSNSELSEDQAWRVPRLQFTGTPLAEVIAMVNRYSARQVVISDRSLDELTLSGVLRADKVEALAEMLEADFGVKVTRAGGTLFLHRTGGPAPGAR